RAREGGVAPGRERRRWQVFHGKEIRRIGGHPEFQFVALASPPDGSRLAWATYRVERIDRNLVGYHGAVAVWDADSGKERCRLQGPELRPKPIAFSPDGKTLALGPAAGPVSLWDATTGKLLRQFDEVALSATDLVFSPDGKVLAVVNIGSATLLDAAAGKLLHRVGPGPDNGPAPFGTGVSFSA